MYNITDPEAKHLDYAGYIRRVLANFIDGFIIIVVLWLPLSAMAAATASQEAGAVLYILGMAGTWIYEAVMNSSSRQSTLGKMALGIKVADLHGNRISFGKATARFFGKGLSYLICSFVFLIAAFTPKKQSLHDIVARTVVIMN